MTTGLDPRKRPISEWERYWTAHSASSWPCRTCGGFTPTMYCYYRDETHVESYQCSNCHSYQIGIWQRQRDRRRFSQALNLGTRRGGGR